MIDDIDRRLIQETQSGLPLVSKPYDAVGKKLGLSGAEVRQRLNAMLATGIIRRIGVVPNHYAVGLRHNGMTVWDVDDEMAVELGRQVGQFDFVSHCYLRPRHLPVWRYNMFAMVHGFSATEMTEKVEIVKEFLGGHVAAHDILRSNRILKKTGLRIAS